MFIQGMYGLGDNIYQRSVIREIKERVYLRTSWPQMYSDLPNIRTVKPVTRLRTQNKNVQRQKESIWHSAPCLPPVRIHYTSSNLNCGSILNTLTKLLGVDSKIFDLPKFTGPKIDKPYVVVRPVTVRSEWYNHARGPDVVYICQAVKILRAHGFYVVSVADIHKQEWCEKLPECDLAFNHGELSFEELMGLIQNARMSLGGVGWLVPACVASKTPLVTILGGQGGHNAPEKIIDKPMNVDKLRFIHPDKYCMCQDNRHNCRKTITNFPNKFLDAVEAVL